MCIRVLQIVYWEFPEGLTGHPLKSSAIIECTFILQDKARAIINGEEIIIQTGDYVVIEPGTPNNLVEEILEYTVGLTIKAPSDPSAKVIL